MECGHALFPLVDCLMLHMKQPDSYHHHNRNNGSKATIIYNTVESHNIV